MEDDARAESQKPGARQVRRPSDDELCGHVEHRDGRWVALTVFGTELGRHDSHEHAVEHVLRDGLAVLAERWTLRNGATGESEIVCIQEANADRVVLVRDLYPGPGVPTLVVTADQLVSREWTLHRQ